MPDGMGCLPPVVSPTLGGSKFEYTSGGSCGCACIIPPKNWDIYLRCYHLRGGRTFEYTSGGSCGCACNLPPKIGDIYLRCYRHLPAVLKRAYPAGDVYLRWLLHRAWQDACHLENYLRCYRLHGGCGFEYTSGGSYGRVCIIPPKSWGHLPPVGQRCLPAVLLGCLPPVVSPTLGGSKFEYTSGGSCGRACNVPPIDRDIYLRCKKYII